MEELGEVFIKRSSLLIHQGDPVTWKQVGPAFGPENEGYVVDLHKINRS